MTTYQEPPLSRRAARQSERAEQASPFGPETGEPLTYVTQNRPPLPGYDVPPRGRRAAEQDVAGAAAPSFRPRDYRPEARTAPAAFRPADDGVVEFQTQARPALSTPPGFPDPAFPDAAAPGPAPSPAPAASTGSLAAALAGEPSEQTLTRRELRAIREAHGIAAAPTDVTGVAEFDRTVTAPASGDSAATRRGRRAAESATETDAGIPVPETASASGSPVVAPVPPVASTPLVASSPPPVVDPPSAPEYRVAPGPAVWAPATEPTADSSAFDALFAPLPSPPSAVAPPIPLVEPSAATILPPTPPAAPEARVATGETRPVGHWRSQAEADDDDLTATISHGDGSTSFATSSLVLPLLPGQDPDTGEVMLTNSISLPSALAATGAHTPLDESHIDHLLDPDDHQLVNTDSVPIRAVRAVSSNSGSRSGLVTPAKPNRGGRVLTALIVSASVMIVVVVTLLVVAVASDVL